LALVLSFATDLFAAGQQGEPEPDWPNLNAYREANAKLALPAEGEARVVFFGDSITYGWNRAGRAFFPGKPYIFRGLKGQTTPQMLIRFRQDVVALRPSVVVILAGTNDVAGNTGPSTLEMIEDNLMSMADLAKANRIRVVLASVLPAADYPWRPGLAPALKTLALNQWMRAYAASHDLIYLDYHSALADADGGMTRGLSIDGVHPNDNGYAIMAPLAERAVAEALALRSR
jgi:lysophospholipase L1-like esterase